MGKKGYNASGSAKSREKGAVREKQISLGYILIALFFISASLFCSSIRSLLPEYFPPCSVITLCFWSSHWRSSVWV
jgi:hypothetical protein